MPEACGPRKDGQLPFPVLGLAGEGTLAPAVLWMRRMGMVFVSPAGDHVRWMDSYAPGTRVATG